MTSNGSGRTQNAKLLAWVEEDPEVAAALFEASFEVPDDSFIQFKAHALEEAILFAILTDSEALARSYYARWKALNYQAGEEEFGMSPLKHFQKVRKWIRARESGEAAQP